MGVLTNQRSRSRHALRRRSVVFRSVIESLEGRLLLSSVVVNTTSDLPNAGPGLVSLRRAIITADSNATPTTITFDPKAFASAKTIRLSGTPLKLTNSQEMTTLIGPAAGVTISGNNQSGGFVIQAGVTADVQT